ncbi:MAG: hypothetical protein ACOYUB_00840 [Patescibacteria group bacterium]
MPEKARVKFEDASFLRQEFQFEMIHPDVGNLCINTGAISWVKAKGHIREEAKAVVKKTCKRCKTPYVLKQQ